MSYGDAHPGGGPAARGAHPSGELPAPRAAASPVRSAPRSRPPHGDGSPSRPAPPAGADDVERPARTPLRRPSVRGQILDALRAALTAGELAPGEVYSAPALGDRFGVSATPVREAMQRLAAEGAVEVVPNRGFRVVARDPRELAELREIRALLELPTVLRLAATVPAERWAELTPLAEATVTAAASGDRARYAESDRAFHRALLGLSGNEQLVHLADDLHRRSQWPPVPGGAARHRAALMADAEQHAVLLEELRARDLTAVQALVWEHIAGAHL
ncbi:GntR family transcriptional regulator [Streptomyces tsukubensis]|uniref:GntR family transcriptional regulator n=1 Tax=Streptomyces tsukubensis TaxID=83656 RepID=A0A1V4AAP7_9ACTN|nr:GntR family transcriptional regulator [Streptomyces tsukubensis]OON80720.1 GntR family transcriptional regulator [Streptomyces tsukubensis]